MVKHCARLFRRTKKHPKKVVGRVACGVGSAMFEPETIPVNNCAVMELNNNAFAVVVGVMQEPLCGVPPCHFRQNRLRLF